MLFSPKTACSCTANIWRGFGRAVPVFLIALFLALPASGTPSAVASANQARPAVQKPSTVIQGQNNTLVVGSEQEYPPFATGMTDATAGGFTVDLWKAVAAETGLSYTIRVLPFHQILQEFKEGKIDVLINLAISDERHKFADFSIPHVTVHGAIFVRKGESGIRTEEDFAGKSIIVVKADRAHEYAVSKGWGKQLVLVNTPAEGMRLLASGKHDAMLLAKLTGMQTLKAAGLTNIEALKSPAGFSLKFAFAVPEGEAVLLGTLNEGLALTKSNGTYDALYEKWFGIYEEKEIGPRDVLKYMIPVAALFLGIFGHLLYRRHVEREVAEKKYRDLYDHAPDMFLSIEAQSATVIDCNQTLLSSMGYSREEIVGRSMHELYHPDCADLVRTAFQTFMSSKEVHDVELELRRKDGSKVYVSMNSSAVCDADGAVLHSRTTLRDITERKLTEAALQRANAYNRSLIEASIDPLVTIGTDGKITDVNQATAAFTGSSREELVGSDFSDYFTDPDKANAGYKQVFLNGTVQDYPLEIKHRDGHVIPVLYNASVYRDVNGKVAGVFAAARDITERKRAEEERLALEQQYQQSQKLESLGVLAGGIAHDFNNILAVIMCNCSLAIQRPNMTEELISEIETAANRAAELCRQMLAYAGKAMSVFTQVKMTALVDDMVKMLKASIHKNVVMKFENTDGLPPIRGDASQIRQIVMNLIINAAEAIGEAQGEIRVSLTKAEIGPEQPKNDHLGKAITPGLYVCLEVADNGCGMDDETRQRIFEPFYTTKCTGRGLGMSAVLGIITTHKGALQLSSQPGQGSTFTLYLPVETNNSGEEPLQQLSSVVWQGSGTILLVEDEPQILLVAKNLMKALGFTVYEASNGREALELYRSNAEYITLVVTDIGMPVMDGYELFRELKKINPELPIIISSGFGDMTVTTQMADDEVAGFLSKPYSFDQLRKVLKGVVENPGYQSSVRSD